jgi:hypothetical protein
MTSLLIMVVSFSFVPKSMHHSYLIFIDEVIYFQVNLTIMVMAAHTQQETSCREPLTKQREIIMEEKATKGSQGQYAIS